MDYFFESRLTTRMNTEMKRHQDDLKPMKDLGVDLQLLFSSGVDEVLRKCRKPPPRQHVKVDMCGIFNVSYNILIVCMHVENTIITR